MGIADAVNGHDVLNQHIRATYDPATGGITFEAKVAGEEGNEFTIDADNTTAFDEPVTTAFTGGSREIPAGAVFDVVAGENDEFSIAVDGIDSGPLTISAGTYTVAQIVAEMQSVIGGSATVAFDATSGQFTITSNSSGIGSSVSLTSGTNDFLQTVGLDRDFAVAGTGPTLLADLNGGNGVDVTTGIEITDREGNNTLIDVSAAATIQDVIDAINTVPNVTAGLNAEGNGINITDNSGFPIQNLVIADTDYCP